MVFACQPLLLHVPATSHLFPQWLNPLRLVVSSTPTLWTDLFPIVYVGKRHIGHVRPAKIQISLRICADISEFSLDWSDCADWQAELNLRWATARIGRLSWIFVGRTCQTIRFLTLRFKYCQNQPTGRVWKVQALSAYKNIHNSLFITRFIITRFCI